MMSPSSRKAMHRAAPGQRSLGYAMIIILGSLILISLLGGCLARVTDRIEKAHAVAAHEADIAAAFIQKAACHAPMDAMVRWCQSSTDTCRAIWYGCPDARAFVSAVTQAVASEKTFRLVIEPVE